MPPPAKAVADLGSVAQNGVGWRARVQLKRRNVDGPTRATHAEAQADLDRARQCASRSELKHVLGRVKVMKVRGASQTAFQKVRMKIRGAAQPAAKAKAKVKQCSKPRCRNNAASPRAKFCIGCFKDNARCTGARTGGNSSAKGVIGNSGGGNSSAKGVIGNGGNSSAKGVVGNKDNRSPKGVIGSSGNRGARKKKIAALVIFYIELAAEARIKKPALNAEAGTIDDTQLDLDKRLTEAEKHAIDIVDVGGTLDEEEKSVEVGVCARCGANAVEVANAGDEGKVCRRCWRNLRAQQLMEQQGPAVVAIMSPESQEEEQ